MSVRLEYLNELHQSPIRDVELTIQPESPARNIRPVSIELACIDASHQ